MPFWYENFSKIYTYGSKSLAETGFAIFFSGNNTHIQHIIPNFCSIFTTKIIAIKSALKWILNHNSIHNALILSDSKSPFKSIINSDINNFSSSLTICNIKKIIYA